MPPKPRIAPRKPPAPVAHLKDASLFVHAGERSDVQASSRPADVRRRDGRALRRLTAYLNAQTFTDLRVRCALEDKDISEALEEGARLWLARQT